MAKKLKNLSKFSEDALNLAIKGMPENEQNNFERGLMYLENVMGVKKTKPPTSTKINDESIFRSSIVPQIQRRIQEIEQMELEHRKCIIHVMFEFKTNFDGLKDEHWKTTHQKIVDLETGLKSLTLLSQYSRGMFYMTIVKKLKLAGQNWKPFVSEEFKISHITTLRYMTLAAIINSYPRLILCELSFTQILKHKSRLMKYLKSEDGQNLESALSLSVEIKAQGRSVSISRMVQEIPATKFATDPDYQYRDSISKCDAEAAAQWETSTSENEEEDLLNAMELCSLKVEQC